MALVAGATRGAGRAIAVELARAGCFVYATGRTSRSAGPSEMGRPETIEETAERVPVFALSRFMGTSIAMIDLHYGHLAVDSHEHAVSLLDGGVACDRVCSVCVPVSYPRDVVNSQKQITKAAATLSSSVYERGSGSSSAFSSRSGSNERNIAAPFASGSPDCRSHIRS